jgi:putative ABC transport system permease protein
MKTCFWDDLKFALRLLAKNPVHSFTAMMTLALGIGANAAVFALADGLLLRVPDLPVLDRLFFAYGRQSLQGAARRQDQEAIAPADFRDWQSELRSFEQIAAWTGWMPDLTGTGEAERLSGSLVTPNFFSTLGVQPMLGRTFSPETDPGAREVILSHGLWVRRFGADTNLVGRTIELSQTTYLVAGILPATVQFPLGTDLWTPLTLNPGDWAVRDRFYLYVVGRLNADVRPRQAAAELRTLAARIASDYPNSHAQRSAELRALRDQLLQGNLGLLAFTGGTTFFVLMLVCANVANLQLARGLSRRHEFAVRAALGASRRRILRQLLTESTLLGLLGGALGILCAIWAVQWLKSDLLAHLPPADLAAVTLSWKGIAFTFGLALLAGVGTGLAPSLATAQFNLMAALKEGARNFTGDRGRQRMRRILVVAQIALAMILMTGAGIFLHALREGLRFAPGYEIDGIVSFQMTPARQRYPDWKQVTLFKDQLLQELAAIPGVLQVAAAETPPLGPARRLMIEAEPAPGVHVSGPVSVQAQAVDPAYFPLLRVPVLGGRGFEESDLASGPAVTVLSETLARRLFPAADAIGRRVRPLNESAATPWLIVVGVVPDLQRDPWGSEPKTLYLPLEQDQPFSLAFLLRTGIQPESVMSAVRDRVRSIDSNQPMLGLNTLRETVRQGLGAVPVLAPVLGGLGLLALGLCALGVYGVVAQNVIARTPEIGVRIAMGATPKAIFRLVLGGGMGLALWGLALGLPMALGLSWLLASQMFELGGLVRLQLVLWTGLLTLIMGAAALACWLPARRAMQTDPIQALRAE